jgi:uncharacterized membrane protein
MKWYQAVLKRILKGIILFLLPVMLLLFVMQKAIAIVQQLILPIKEYLPAERILGIGLLTLISLLLILMICYFAGILAESKRVKLFITLLEDNLLVYIPGYTMMKSRASEAIGDTDDEWRAVMIGDGDEWKLGIEVDQQPDGYCTVFFPEPPDAKSGEMKLIHSSKLKKLDMSVSKLITIIKRYGHGASVLANE